MSGIVVVKKNGVRESFKAEKLLESLERAGAPDARFVLENLGLSGEVQSSVIFDKAQLIMLNLVVEDFKWHEAARNYLLWRIYKEVWGKNVIKALNEGELDFELIYKDGFKTWFKTGLELGVWEVEIANWYGEHIDELAEHLNPKRDFLLTYNGVRVLYSRCLLKRTDGTIFEAPQYMWMRVAMGIAYAELRYGGDPIYWAKRFYDMMSELKFVPNSPTLYNAMTRLGQLSACFVIPVDDCLTKDNDTNRDDPECKFGIMDALKLAALIFQSGGGVGYNFGKLRPEGDIVRSTTGIASGPLSFMMLFDALVETIKQGGKRRGAQMGMLFWWHPDIEKFILSKSGKLKEVQLQNFNISVVIDDFFMTRVLNGEDVYLINPRECTCLYKTWGEEFVKCYEECVKAIQNGRIRIWRRVNAGEIWRKIVYSAWDSGDPGLWNKDLANLVNNERLPGEVINATNPCSEESLYDFESCNLGSINLTKYVREGEFDWKALAEDVKIAVRFLDDVIDVNKLPHEMLRRKVLKTRRIGLGVNGFADVLISLGIKYDSPEGIAFADILAKFVSHMAVRSSIELARERGVYPAFGYSDWVKGILPWMKHRERIEKFSRRVNSKEVDEYLRTLERGYENEGIKRLHEGALRVLREYRALDEDLIEDLKRVGIRNGSVMSIAPEGSRSLIAGVNPSIEPLFAIAFIRNLSIGRLIEYNLTALRLLKEKGLWNEGIRRFVEEYGVLPPNHELRDVLRTTLEIHWKWHVYMLVTWARWNDSGVSKTINLPSEATVEDVDGAFKLAWLLGAYGITVYRDKSRSVQVIYAGIRRPDVKPLDALKRAAIVRIGKGEIRIEEGVGERTKRKVEEAELPYCPSGVCE